MSDILEKLEQLADEDYLKTLTAAELQALQEELKRLGPVANFPHHRQQLKGLSAATDTIVVIGGNQSGKSTLGEHIVARLVRREGPIFNRLRKKRREGKLRIWVSPVTFEKYTSNWEKRITQNVMKGMNFSYKTSPYPVAEWEDDFGGGEIWGKSQDQGWMAFESDVVDLILFDEEPEDRKIYTSARQRLATTNGVIVFTFTPLRGLSWTHSEFYKHTAKKEYKKSDRCYVRGGACTLIQMGMADNPESVAGGGVRRMMEDPAISEAERSCRLFGEYGFTEGLIWANSMHLSTDRESLYIIDELPQVPLSYTVTLDPNKRHGGIFAANDPESNWYIFDEHYQEDVPDRVHAEMLMQKARRWNLMLAGTMEQDEPPQAMVEKRTLKGTADVFADPGGAGAQAIINLNDLGIYAAAVEKGAGTVKSSIELIRRALAIDPTHIHPITGVTGAPHLYFLRSLRTKWEKDGAPYVESRLLWEMRQYRQKANAAIDTPIKKFDDLVDALRYLFLARQFAPLPLEDDTEAKRMAALDPISRRASKEFDDMLASVKRGYNKKPTDPHMGEYM